MSRRVLLETNYTFNPATRTVVIPRLVQQERLVLITNVTTGTPILNFSDPALKATSYTLDTSSNGGGTTTVVLNFDTSAMSSTDTLQIIWDELYQKFSPSETLMDPVGKFRTSQPQSLIDTDFEYGLQPTKWENIQMVNNRTSFYVLPQAPNATITAMDTTANSRTVTVRTPTTTNIIAGHPVYINGSTYAPADGFYVIGTVSAGASFVYDMKREAPATANIFSFGQTQVFANGSAVVATSPGAYTGNNIPLLANSVSGNAVTFTVGSTSVHGLRVGNYVMIRNTAAATSGAPNGTWPVTGVVNSTAFTVLTTTSPTGAVTGGTLHARPEGTFYHRPFDGGVQYSTTAASHNLMMARQTRRYFRYQSGKGIQFSTGAVIKPNFNIEAITASVYTVTVVTKAAHQLVPGVTITIEGCLPAGSAFNGDFEITEVPDPYTFKYTALSEPPALASGSVPTVIVNNWYHAAARVGMFDLQNGFFYEYDGQTLWAVRRNSTQQLLGTVVATNGSSFITGTNTQFARQLNPGDYVVIRGMSYRVETILSDTSMTVLPEYRGVSMTGGMKAILSKTIDTRIPQSQWNIDKLDGTGPTGYNIDLKRIQMLYMDYSWYGAGAVRYGFKDIRGEVTYAHRLVHNNVSTEAYMRSGNLPARYETNTNGYTTRLMDTLAAGATTITVESTTGFPNTGSIVIGDPVAYEYCYYTGKTSTTFTGVTRGKAGGTLAVNTTTGSAVLSAASTATLQPGMYVQGNGIATGSWIVSLGPTTITLNQGALLTNTGVTMSFFAMGATGASTTHTYSAVAPIAVQGHAPQFSPLVSHWGSSVIMDGRYDDDKSFVFSVGMPSVVAVTTGQRVALLSLRIAPSVDNGISGVVGVKEVINRMQLTLRNLDFLSDGRFLCELIMNGMTLASNTFVQANNNPASMAQVAIFPAGQTVTGGESVYSFYTDGPGNNTYTNTLRSLDLVRDLGNSIQGGGTTNVTSNSAVSAGTLNMYPDGPDVVTLVVQNLEAATRNISARVSWTEAQA